MGLCEARGNVFQRTPPMGRSDVSKEQRRWNKETFVGPSRDGCRWDGVSTPGRNIAPGEKKGVTDIRKYIYGEFIPLIGEACCHAPHWSHSTAIIIADCGVSLRCYPGAKVGRCGRNRWVSLWIGLHFQKDPLRAKPEHRAHHAMYS
jgi:hypothetical protein